MRSQGVVVSRIEWFIAYGYPGQIPFEALAAFNRQLLDSVVKPMTRDGVTPDAPEVLQSLAAGVAHDAQRFLEIQNRYYQKQLELWTGIAQLKPDAPAPKVVEPEPGDRRFRGSEWQQPYFSLVAQSYLLNARWLTELVENAQLEPHAKKKLSFLRAST
jgi:polyhydroxyalkanoate synthase